jgi:hypothetical protein
MSHDHDQARSRGAAGAPSHHGADADPGRQNRTANLDAPERPLTSGLLQRQARDEHGVAAGADHAVATAAASTGSALPGSIQRKFEGSLGADLSGVRVHSGEASAQAADAVGAKAYTVGQDIHFGAGNYDPASTAGEHLLAHEVAHTVQQRGGTPTRQHKLEVSGPADAAEHEADRAADAMVAGAPASVASAGGLQRDFDPNKKKAAVDTSGNGPGTVTGLPGWDPQLSVGAPAPATVKLGGAARITGTVTNASQAPAGTTTGWVFSSMAKPGLAPGAAPAAGPTGTLTAKVESLETMAHAPIAGVKYTVPGAAERVKDAAAPSAFAVAEPAATWTMEHVDGKADDTLEIAKLKRSPDQLVLGDTVKLRAKIDNVERPQELVAPVLTGGGMKAAPAPEWNGNTVTFSYVLQQAANHANHEATTAKMQLKLPAGAAPRILEHDFQYRVVLSKQRFINMCSQAIGKLGESHMNFSAYLSKLTLAYADAYKTHTTKIEAIGKAAAARDAFNCSLVLSFIPGGIGGGVGEMMKKMTSSAPIIDGVKEMSKFAPKVAATVGAESHFSAVPDTDPLQMQNATNARAIAELAAVSKLVNGWLAAANANDPSLALDFDPFEVTMNALRISDGIDVSKAVPFDAPGSTQKFQQGFFCTWVDRHAARSFMETSQYSWGKAEPQIAAYGTSIGVADAPQRVSSAVTKGVMEHNERARKGPRAGAWL